jgi:hypothetical protein
MQSEIFDTLRVFGDDLPPRIAYFFGISIYMYLDDHGTSH